MPTRQDIQTSAEKLIGVRWHHQGRSPEAGIDCIGEVIFTGIDSGCFTQEYIDTVDFLNYSRQTDSYHTLIAILKREMVEIPIDSIREGDVVAIRMNAEHFPSHVGIVTKGEREYLLVHALEGKTTIAEPLRKWGKYITHGFSFKGVSN